LYKCIWVISPGPHGIRIIKSSPYLAVGPGLPSPSPESESESESESGPLIIVFLESASVRSSLAAHKSQMADHVVLR